tara:strand:- start:8753 stop:9274 length:522 start_codon:yes stop_codon:yes gene_type:complete
MKVAFVIGHHKESKGALNVLSNLREFDYYTEVMKEFTDHDVYIHDSTIKGYTARIKDTSSRINKKHYDLVISLHFNSFSNDTANGCTTLYYGMNTESKRLAHKFSNTVRELADIKLRNYGANALMNINDRGFAMVYYPKAPVILIEPFFGSNLEDCKKIDVCKMSEIIKAFLK